MIRKSLIFSLTLLFVVGLAACVAAPAATESTAGTTETVAEEAMAEATAAPVEEAASEVSAEPASYAVDVAASTVGWFGSKPVGGSHTGTVAISEGKMNFAGDQLIDGSINIDMTTITDATEGLSADMAAKLVGHLSSDDFFGVESYPTATLVLKSAEATGTENQYLVKADLTIKETTKEIEFTTDVMVGDGTITANADIVVNRADFDVRYGSGSFFDNLGDDLISDEIEMSVTLVANS